MEIIKKLEALLFVCGSDGITFSQLSKILEISKPELETIIKSYEKKLNNFESAIKLEVFGEKYKLTTKSEMDEILSKLVDNKPNKLSQSALETLAIIAYKNPLTRIEIENIRGVDCTFIISKLVSLDLIQEAGRAQSPGSPILYEVSDYFMDFFKLQDLSQLPQLPDLAKADADDVNIYKSQFKEEK